MAKGVFETPSGLKSRTRGKRRAEEHASGLIARLSRRVVASAAMPLQISD